MNSNQDQTARELIELLKGSDRVRRTAKGVEFKDDGGNWIAIDNSSSPINNQIVRTRRTRPKEDLGFSAFAILSVKRYRARFIPPDPEDVAPPRPALYCAVWASDPRSEVPYGLTNFDLVPYVRYGFVSGLNIEDRRFDAPLPRDRYEDFTNGQPFQATFTRVAYGSYGDPRYCICYYYEEGSELPPLPSSILQEQIGLSDPPAWRRVDDILVYAASEGGDPADGDYEIENRMEYYAYTVNGKISKIAESGWNNTPFIWQFLPAVVNRKLYIDEFRPEQGFPLQPTAHKFYQVSRSSTLTQISECKTWRKPLFESEQSPVPCVRFYISDPTVNFDSALSTIFSSSSDFATSIISGARRIKAEVTIRRIKTGVDTCLFQSEGEKRGFVFKPPPLQDLDIQGERPLPDGRTIPADELRMAGIAYG